jgi:hypothetical protein
MEALIIHPKTPDKLKEIKGVLKALKIDFEVAPTEKMSDLDETEFLSSSPANKERLDSSIKNIEEGKTTRVKFHDLWK